MTRDELMPLIRNSLIENIPTLLRSPIKDEHIEAVLDALDALGQGPKRVAELEGALLKTDAQREVLADLLNAACNAIEWWCSSYPEGASEADNEFLKNAWGTLKGQDNG